AVAQNRATAILMGVDVNRVSMFVFALSSALGVAAGALGGALYAVAPGGSGGLVSKGLAVLILGARGAIPLAGGGRRVLGVTESGPAACGASGHKDVIACVLMIAVPPVRPQGLVRRGALGRSPTPASPRPSSPRSHSRRA